MADGTADRHSLQPDVFARRPRAEHRRCDSNASQSGLRSQRIDRSLRRAQRGSAEKTRGFRWRALSLFFRLSSALLLVAFASGCSDESSNSEKPLTDEQFKETIVTELHDTMLEDIEALLKAAADIRDTAPS